MEEIDNRNENLPSLQVNVPNSLTPATDQVKQLIPDEKIINYYEEAIENIKEDRHTADEAFKTFLDLVINGGDATSASKEAMVNLLKIKTESNDKMLKILELWTRMHLRDRDTFPKYLAVQQNNKIEGTSRPARKMIEMMKELNQMKPNEEQNAN